MINLDSPSRTSLPQPLAQPALAARRTVTVLLGTLFIAACAHIAVPLPWTPVPMTLQPFAVLLLGLLLGPGLGAATCAAYLLEGAGGLPVFTPAGPGGILQLLGPTGGYLLSYPFAAAVAGFLGRASGSAAFSQSPRSEASRSEASGSRGFALGRPLVGALAANVLILAAGACWLAVVSRAGAGAVLHAAVLPFLAGDALKVVLAALLAAGWRSTRFDRAHTSLQQ